MPETPPPFSARIERRGETVVVALHGELDMATGPEGLAAMTSAIDARPPSLLVDLQGLLFMDSMGLQTLMRARGLAVEAGVRLAVLNGTGVPHRLLTLTGMDAIFEMVDDVAELDPPMDGLR